MTVEFPPRQMAPELARLLTFPCSLCNSLPLLPRHIHACVSPPRNQPNTPLICVPSTLSCQPAPFSNSEHRAYANLLYEST